MRSLFFTVFIVLSFAEPQYAIDKIKYGRISKEERKLESCSFDPEANAVILNFTGEIEVNSNHVLIHRHIRIKILKEGGVKYANVKIPYYAKEGYEKFYSIKAQTINAGDQDKAEYYEVEKRSMFDADLSEEWGEKRFTFPNVKVGSILEYEYTIISENHLYLENWNFQNELPTLYAGLKVEIPPYLDYRLLLQGSRLTRKYKVEATNFWELENLPALKDEPFLYNKEDFVELLQFQLAGYYTKKSYGGGTDYNSLRKTWKNLSDEILNSYEYRSYLNKSGFAKDILNNLPLSGLNQKEKIQLLYNYVANNYTWNGKYRRFTYNRLNELGSNSEAHSSEINLLLILLLNEAGIEAYPLLISTRSNGAYMKDYPFLSQFNHLIAYVKTDGEELFLDALDPYRPYTVLPEEDLVSEGFVLDKKDPRWIDITHTAQSIEIYRVLIELTEAGFLNVELAMESNGLKAVNYRKKIVANGNGKWFGSIFEDKVEINNDSPVIENVKNADTALLVKANLGKKITSSSGAGTLYLNPFILGEFSENPFKSDTRYFPIQFPYQHSLKYLCSLVLPEGFEIVEVPKSERIKLPNNYGDFTYWISSAGRTVSLQVLFNINELEVPAIQFENLKEFYNILIARLDQQLVIKKIK